MTAPVSISINRVPAGAAYCLQCAEYRSTIKVQTREVIAFLHDYFKTIIICGDCGSKNVKPLQNQSTGLKPRTEVVKDV